MLRDGLALGAWDGDRLVGFVCVVSDGRFRAFVEDVVVHPDNRRAGMGTLLLARVVEAPDDIETVTLCCKPTQVPFYERYGCRVGHR